MATSNELKAALTKKIASRLGKTDLKTTWSTRITEITDEGRAYGRVLFTAIDDYAGEIMVPDAAFTEYTPKIEEALIETGGLITAKGNASFEKMYGVTLRHLRGQKWRVERVTGEDMPNDYDFRCTSVYAAGDNRNEMIADSSSFDYVVMEDIGNQLDEVLRIDDMELELESFFINPSDREQIRGVVNIVDRVILPVYDSEIEPYVTKYLGLPMLKKRPENGEGVEYLEIVRRFEEPLEELMASVRDIQRLVGHLRSADVRTIFGMTVMSHTHDATEHIRNMQMALDRIASSTPQSANDRIEEIKEESLLIIRRRGFALVEDMTDIASQCTDMLKDE